MPEVTINGEKKKVACGPCIRGHRSSKCTHKDRLLIEVRKPGRPLSACPHPAGSCSCERLVINYAIPKSTASECACPPTRSTPSGGATSRIEKSKGRKSISSNVTPSSVEKALSGDPALLARTANPVNNLKPAPRSDGTPSIPSETSTPTGESSVGITSDAVGQDENRAPNVRVGALENSPYGAPADASGWNNQSSGRYPSKQTKSDVKEQPKNRPSCCNPQPKEPIIPPPRPFCCNPAAKAQANVPQNPQNQGFPPSYPSGPINSNGTFGFNNAQIIANGVSDGPSFNHGSQYPTTPQAAFQSYPVNAASMSFPQTAGLPMIPPRCAPMSNPNNHDAAYSCTCGDDCACFACAVHPTNKTTTAYVQYHALGYYDNPQMMNQPVPQSPYTFPSTQPQFVPTQNMGMQNNQIDPQFQSFFWAEQQKFTHPTNANTTIPWHMGPNALPSQATPTLELENFHLRTPISEFPGFKGISRPEGQNIQVAAGNAQTSNPQPPPHGQIGFAEFGLGTAAMDAPPYDHESPQGTGGDTPTLSPSNFFVNTFTLAGCCDSTGTCLCGEGCDCPGCLTHGPRGVNPSESATGSGQGDSRAHDLNGFSLGNAYTHADMANHIATTMSHPQSPLAAMPTSPFHAVPG